MMKNIMVLLTVAVLGGSQAVSMNNGLQSNLEAIGENLENMAGGTTQMIEFLNKKDMNEKFYFELNAFMQKKQNAVIKDECKFNTIQAKNIKSVISPVQSNVIVAQNAVIKNKALVRKQCKTEIIEAKNIKSVISPVQSNVIVAQNAVIKDKAVVKKQGFFRSLCNKAAKNKGKLLLAGLFAGAAYSAYSLGLIEETVSVGRLIVGLSLESLNHKFLGCQSLSVVANAIAGYHGESFGGSTLR